MAYVRDTLRSMRLKPKTLGIPGDMLAQLEAVAKRWNDRRGERPDSINSWHNCTWADVVRYACGEVLKRKRKKQGQLPL